MVRTQVQLSEEQATRVKRIASERHVSISAVIRNLIDEALPDVEGGDRHSRALGCVGKHASGTSHVAREHDRELSEIYGR